MLQHTRSGALRQIAHAPCTIEALSKGLQTGTRSND